MEPPWTLTGDDNFGYQFANVGDITGDGEDEFAVTAINGDGDEASLSGSVTIYEGGGSGRVLKKLGGEQALDKFGDSLAVLDDLNDDGYGEIAIGVPSFYAIPFQMPQHRGTVWVFRGGTGNRTINTDAPGEDLVTAIYGETYLERFGSTMARLGDLDGDGLSDLAVAALHANAEGATNLEDGLLAGKVFVFKSGCMQIDGSQITLRPPLP